MLDWLHRFLRWAGHLIPEPIRHAFDTIGGAIAGLFGTITNDVYDAWTTFTASVWAWADAAADFAEETWRSLNQVIGHLIPHYAMTAFWWITHPAQLADVLFWHLLRYLEERAWTAARYLGRFVLALLTHHVRRITALAEEIIAAIL